MTHGSRRAGGGERLGLVFLCYYPKGMGWTSCFISSDPEQPSGHCTGMLRSSSHWMWGWGWALLSPCFSQRCGAREALNLAALWQGSPVSPQGTEWRQHPTFVTWLHLQAGDLFQMKYPQLHSHSRNGAALLFLPGHVLLLKDLWMWLSLEKKGCGACSEQLIHLVSDHWTCSFYPIGKKELIMHGLSVQT